MRRTLTAFFLVACALTALTARAQLNTTADDYAAAFRTLHSGAIELWFTSSRDAHDGRARAMYIADGSDTGFANIMLAPSPVNLASEGMLDVSLTGAPAFALCDGDIGMFVSNRHSEGPYAGNDIFTLRHSGSTWTATRLSPVNSSEWDDSPALTADGNRLYFASDRRYPGTRRADLYMSELRDGAWTEPRPLIELNTAEFSEETPFVSDDGYLYYSTNRAGDFDIWRTKLDDRGLPQDAGEPVAGVNRKGSDETHPAISPGGGFFVYSTNAHEDGRKDFDIKWIKLKRHDPVLEIDVRKRHRQSTERVASTVQLQIAGNSSNLERGVMERRVELPTSASEPSHVKLEAMLGDPTTPAADKRQFQIIARAQTTERQFVTAVDTLIGYRTCSSLLPHTVFLWDTAAYYEQSCVDTFPIKKVQYFVTGYWCPTTKRFESYLECPTLFYDTACLQPVCPPSEVFSYKVSVNRQHSECIDYKEFDQKGAGFATSVDDAIEQHLKAMESAFGSACMKRTIAQGKPVRVVVEGFTDPRGYGADCHYFGPDIDFSRSSVQVPEEMKAHFHHNARMKEYGAQGNQLLSELRAYNLAVLLDKVWTERIAQYRQLKSAGLLTTLAIGRAISQDAIPFEQRRSAQVSIESQSEGVIIPGQVPPPGQRVVLCEECR